MSVLLSVIQVLACVLLIVAVLLQTGKGAEMGVVFGSSQAIFGTGGPRGFLVKLTAVLAAVFLLGSLALGYISSHRLKASTVVQEVVKQGEKSPPPAGPVAPSDKPR